MVIPLEEKKYIAEQEKTAYYKLTAFVLLCRWQQEVDNDIFTLVSGFKGFGKSSCIIQFGRRYIELFGLTCPKCLHEWIYTGKALINKGKIKERFAEPCPKCKNPIVTNTKELNFKSYMAYDNEDIKEKIFNLPPYSIILCDEAVRFMMGEDWAKVENKSMKKLFAQMRTKHLIVLANIPHMRWTDTKYRNVMCNIWIRMMVRGLAVVNLPDLGETDDPWHIKDYEKLLGNYNILSDPENIEFKIERLVRSHPCAFDYFKIPPVPADIYKKYLEERDRRVFEQKQKEEDLDSKDISKIVIYNLVYSWDKIKEELKGKKKISLDFCSNVLSINPLNDKPLISLSQASNWVREVRRLVLKKNPENKKDVEDDEEIENLN